ncbi:MAG: glycosyltransferase [Azospirillaceae bacterium]|nr:glycosyltransferase [Azospirillaceae bacterium]
MDAFPLESADAGRDRGRTPITIAHLITGLESGGAEAMLARLVSAMDGRRFRNVVICMTHPGPLADTIVAGGIPVYSLGLRRGRADPRALVKLVATLRREAPMVLQTWLYHADLLGALAAPLAGVARLAWNLRCSNMDMRQYGRVSRLLPSILARLSRLPDAVMVNSEAGLGAHARHGYRPRRWEVIPNGFDVDRFRPDPDAAMQLRATLGLPFDCVLIGLPARFDPMKDHATFLAAAGELAQEVPNVRFLLVGRGAEPGIPALDALIALYGLAGRVVMLGERHDMDRILPALDIVALSSAFGEGFPNVLGEAMACGVPCATTDVGDAARIVGRLGRVVPPRSPSALAAAWRSILQLGPDGRRQLGETARRHIEESYALPAIVRRYENFYVDLVETPAA